jgi:hypothetical protein
MIVQLMVVVVVDYDEVVVVLVVHQFDIVQILVFVYEVVVVLVVHQFDIVQTLVFVYEVVFVFQHNYFDYLDHDYYTMMMMDDYNLQNQNYLFDHLVEDIDDNRFLRRNIVVDDNYHHRHDHGLFEWKGYNHLNVIDLDYHHRHHRD